MSPPSLHSLTTLGYFCAPPGHYWEWDCGTGLWDEAVRRHDTPEGVVLRLELNGLLRSLADEGLPPLGSLLLVLDALEREWDPSATRHHLYEAARGFTWEQTTPNGVTRVWKTLQRGLEEIHGLPEELRSGGPARQTLLRVLFEGSSVRLAPALSREVVDEFLATPSVAVFQRPTPGLNGIARMLRDLTALEKVFNDIPPGMLEQRLRTGLGDTVSATPDLACTAADAPPPPSLPADLLEALEREGKEAAQVAGITRRLAAILHVPKPVARRDDLPLGGVSDVSNRGDPSRLLMTELAWDDLTFAVRLAQGEALYLRRESPPAEPPPRRVVLLDTGIFMWGKPRLFGLGATLALLRQKGGESAGGTAFTLAAGKFVPLSLDTVAEVQGQLARLEPHPHPGAALAELMQAEPALADVKTEVFMVTHPAALECLTPLPAWQHLAERVPLHSLTVDRGGAIVLARHSLAGARVLSQARVDLDEIVRGSAAQKPASVSLTDAVGQVPAFYRQRPWPLYLPTPPQAGQVFQVGGKGYAGVSVTGVVCWWPLSMPAGQVLHPSAPPGTLWTVTVCPEDERRLFLLFRSSTVGEMVVLSVRIDGQEQAAQIVLKTHPQFIGGVRLQSGALVVYQKDIIQAVAPEDGRVIATVERRAHDTGPLPWFDGAAFHAGGSARMPEMLTPMLQPPAQVQKRHLIGSVASVGFGRFGGLMLRKEKGRLYHLGMDEDDGGLVWALMHDEERDGLRDLAPVELPDWPGWADHGLRQAVFPDGRRIVHDPRGLLHVIGPEGAEAAQFSVLVVKGPSAAWSSGGSHYGDPALLGTEERGSVRSLKSLFQTLLRAPGTAPVPAAASGARPLALPRA